MTKLQYQQSESAECGLVCLAYASSRLGCDVDLPSLRRRFSVSVRGLNLRQLSEIAASMDMHGRAVRCELEELGQLKLPAVLHWKLKHFVVLDKVAAGYIVVHDPSKGRTKVSMAEVSKQFSGVALELSQAPGFKPKRQSSPLSIWAWIRFSPELFSGLGQTLLLSIMLQAYVVASPFYMQLAIDQAALKGDVDLLTTLALGFGMFGLFNLGASWLRSLAMQQVAAHMSWDMSLRLLRHLIRLPLDWFQKRRLADTISRFDAINPIRDLVSGSLIASVIDGALAVTTLCMMFVFAWPLAVAVLLGILCYAVVRLATLSESMRLGSANLGAQITENGKRIELIKAIQTVKVMAGETHQEAQWSDKYASVIKKRLASGNFQLSIQAAQTFFDVLISTLTIYLGARSIINHQMTVGLLYAFMSYKGQFTSAVVSVIEQAIQWKLSDIYSYRLADIVLTPKEEGIDLIETSLPDIVGKIEIENLGFRYAPYEPFVFKGLNLTVEAGDFIAIVGASGAGKSTLLKILCGLYQPTFGEVRLDDRPLAAWGPKKLRGACGVVMQDDELLSGTIAENVAFFDEFIDMDRVWRALEAAALKTDVLAMPMKADTVVGDMGNSLSGGQKQRVLIARALYKQPMILFFDEATSHLDVRTEAIINDSLRKLKITRVVIAHRQETIRAADHIFDIHRGALVTLPAHERRPASSPDARQLDAHEQP
jgi:ATP-binding cassette subfamily B protein RaxB